MQEANKGYSGEYDVPILILLILGILYKKYGQSFEDKMGDSHFVLMFGIGCVLVLCLIWWICHYIEKIHNKFKMWRFGIQGDTRGMAYVFYNFDLHKHLKNFYAKGANIGRTFLGLSAENNNKEIVTIPDEQRIHHMQVLGMTGTGKTSGVFMPLIYQDALKNRPVIILDAKGELTTINQINAMLASIGRADDFLLFSLVYKDISCSYNPLSVGECDPQIVIDAFLDNYINDNTYYRETSITIFTKAFYILHSLGKPFTVMDVYTYLTKPSCFSYINKQIKEDNEKGMTSLKLLENLIDRLQGQHDGWEKIIAGFTNYLFSYQDSILNEADSEIILTDVIRQRKIVYFQLPTNAYPIQAIGIARMVQANLRYISSLIQAGQIPKDILVSVIIDEYGSFAEKSFISVLNKARSSGMMVTIAHQSLSDLKMVSDTFMDLVDQNTLNKVYLKQNDPELCELIAKSLGTFTKHENTWRSTAGKFGNQVYTGESSSRVVNEFNFPPDRIKRLNKLGQGYFIYRGDNSQKCVNFGQFENLPELQYKPKFKTGKREGLRLFEKYYINAKRPKIAKPEKENQQGDGGQMSIGDLQ